MINLRLSQDSFFNKIISYFHKVKIKSFYNVKGTKWYTAQEKLAFLVYKIINDLSYREVIDEIEVNGKKPHYTTLQKFADSLSTKLITKIRRISYLICESLKRVKKLASIDGTGLSKCRASRHYERRVGHLKSAKLFDKLSILVDCESKLILDWKFRVKTAHDVKDVHYLLPKAKGYQYILLDKGYDAEWIYELAFKLNLIPQIPSRKWSKKGFYRKKAKKLFNKIIYNMRNIVECVYSSFKRVEGEKLRSCKARTKKLELAIKILKYNLRQVGKLSLISIQVLIEICFINQKFTNFKFTFYKTSSDNIIQN